MTSGRPKLELPLLTQNTKSTSHRSFFLRKSDPQWYERLSWLAGCRDCKEGEHVLYCFPCALFSGEHTGCWSKSGYTKLANLRGLLTLKMCSGTSLIIDAAVQQIPYSRYVQQIPYSRIPYSRIPYSMIPYSRIPYSRIPYSRIPYSRMPYSRIPYCRHLSPTYFKFRNCHWLSLSWLETVQQSTCAVLAGPPGFSLRQALILSS